MAPTDISGSLVAMFLYDLCDEIRLDDLRAILNAPPPGREPPFRQPAPEYVRFARPPVVEPIPAFDLRRGDRASGRVAYFDYGVMSLNLEIPFSGDWDKVTSWVSCWMNTEELERRSRELAGTLIAKAKPALVNEYSEVLTEDYYAIALRPLSGESRRPFTADELIGSFGRRIASLVRGETADFSAAELHEILGARMSYYPSDLLVVGWSAALVYDAPDGALPTLQLLEYANSQLLEFRHYDAALTRLLSDVYRKLERGTGLVGRWRLAREAESLSLIRLEIRELTERVDNSIKFLSDMFAARLYRMAAARIGVPDYRTLVEQKLQSAGELYGFMMDRFYQSRAFILELMVVVILIIELIFLFRGK
jgi:hypothetical protein